MVNRSRHSPDVCGSGAQHRPFHATESRLDACGPWADVVLEDTRPKEGRPSDQRHNECQWHGNWDAAPTALVGIAFCAFDSARPKRLPANIARYGGRAQLGISHNMPALKKAP
jgi:hypothetical protein